MFGTNIAGNSVLGKGKTVRD